MVNDHNDQSMWQTFHVASRSVRFRARPSDDSVFNHMRETSEVLEYYSYNYVPLPTPLLISHSLTSVLGARRSALSFGRGTLNMEEITTLLHYSYGVTKSNHPDIYPRSFRTVPSAGGIFPFDIYFWANRVEDMVRGLYHFHPLRHAVTMLKSEELVECMRAGYAQGELFDQAALSILLVASFERTMFKYGERGYRFILIEAGHIGQNIALCSAGLDLKSCCIGGTLDPALDAGCGLDGTAQAVVYSVLIGKGERSNDAAR